MAEAKEDRNQLIIGLYNQGLVPSEILKELHRRGFTDIKKLSGVKSRLHDLRQKGLIGYRDERYKTPAIKPAVEEPSITLASPATGTAPATKRMSFWLPVPVIEKIKEMAANQGKTASAILREILKKHL